MVVAMLVPFGRLPSSPIPRPPHIGVQPLPMMNPRVNVPIPDCCWIVRICWLRLRPISIYGAKSLLADTVHVPDCVVTLIDARPLAPAESLAATAKVYVVEAFSPVTRNVVVL